MPVAVVRDDGERGLRGFLNRGGFWRLLAVLVVYLAIYLGAGWVSGKVGGHYVDDDLLSSVGSVFFQLTFALVIGAVVLVAFSAYMGWNARDVRPPAHLPVVVDVDRSGRRAHADRAARARHRLG